MSVLVITAAGQGLRTQPILTADEVGELQQYARDVARSKRDKAERATRTMLAVARSMDQIARAKVARKLKNEEPKSAAKYMAGAAIGGAAAALLKGKK